MRQKYTGPPMTLKNMRSLGMQSIMALCGCGHGAATDVSALTGDTPVPSIKFRMRCSACGSRPIDVRPDWRKYKAQGAGEAG